MNSSIQDPYMILGLTPGATGRQIKKAYRRLAMKFHPDRNMDDPEAEKKFKEIQRANEMLRNRSRQKIISTSDDSQWNHFADSDDPFLRFFAAVRRSCVRKKADG